jgi:hypothetical protein
MCDFIDRLLRLAIALRRAPRQFELLLRIPVFGHIDIGFSNACS